MLVGTNAFVKLDTSSRPFLCLAGPDVSVSCTNEDKTGLGPDAIEEHSILPHREYMKEMLRSKFCIMIPGETQNTPRLTEAFLSGT